MSYNLLCFFLKEKPQPYNFGYNIDDGYGNTQFRNEEGDDYGNKKGKKMPPDCLFTQQH